MATIGLSIVGAAGSTAIGLGPIPGKIVGGMLGGYIDNRWLYPTVFPPDDVIGPRLDDFQFQTASEGSPINFCQGPTNRLAGTVLWMTDLIESKHEEQASGKGGGEQAITQFSYSVHAAIAICEGVIQSVEKIWADGKIFYDADPSVDISSDKLSCEIKGLTISGTSLARYMIISSPNDGPDLSILQSGVDVVMAGWTDSDNNGTFMCWSSEKALNGTSTARFLVGADASNEAAGNTITLDQTLPETDITNVDDVTIYTGTDSQIPDSLIESYEGPGDVPGFQNIAYIVLEGLKLRDFGNRMPQFQFLIKKDTSKSVQSAVEDLVTRSQLTNADVDITSLADAGAVRGFCISGPWETRRALQPYMVGFDLLVREVEGKVAFTRRQDSETVEINADDLATHDEGSDSSARPISIIDNSGINLPSEMGIKFIDVNNNFQQGHQRERRVDAPTAGIVSLNVPFALTADEARDIAARELWLQWRNRQIISLTLPPSYIHVQINDILEVAVAGETHKILVQKIDRGHNHIMAIEGLIEQDYLDFDSPDAGWSNKWEPMLTPPGEVIVIFVDEGPLRSVDISTPGFYIATAMLDVNKEWKGAAVYIAPQGEPDNFILHCWNEKEATLGFADADIPAGPIGYWDRKNTITVELREGELESKSAFSVLQGENWAYIGNCFGGEIIGFQTASLIGTRTYELTNLLRGLRGTENFVNSHWGADAEEYFVLLSKAGIEFRPVDLSLIGTTISFQAVAVGASLKESGDVPWTKSVGANTITPFAPCHVLGSRDGSNNLTITWVRRIRSLMRILGALGTPKLEPTEKYELDIYDGATVVRTIIVTSATTIIYTAAQQTTDGLTPGNPVDLKIYQISDLYGRGRVKEITV